MAKLDEFLSEDIPRLLKQVPGYSVVDRSEAAATKPSNPFSSGTSAAPSAAWVVTESMKTEADNVFYGLAGARRGRVAGDAVKDIFYRSGLPETVLARIWTLSDVDKDSHLDSDEFALAMHLLDMAKAGDDLPSSLHFSMIPPSKRTGLKFRNV